MQPVFLRGQVIYLPSLHLIPVCTSVQGVSQLVLIRTMSTCMTGSVQLCMTGSVQLCMTGSVQLCMTGSVQLCMTGLHDINCATSAIHCVSIIAI